MLSILFWGALLPGCAISGGATLAAAEPANDLFQAYEVVTGTARQQTVLTGFFLGGATAELAVAYVDANQGRHVEMYGFDGGAWVSVLDARLRPEVLFVDVLEIGGRDRLITYESGRLSWFDPESATERPLVEVTMSYRATSPVELPHVDITRDVNRDGRDDLLVPDVDGFWVSTQLGDGTFTDAVKLGPPEPFRDEPVGGLDLDAGARASSTYGEVGITAETAPVYLRRVHEMDYDHDGRSDLVFWNRDHFEVHRQDERGRFEPVAGTFTTEVPFDSEGVYSRAVDYRGQGALGAVFGFGKRTERTVLHSLRDLNGDQVADLVTLTLAGRSLTRQRSVYEVHFGTATPDGTVFDRAGSTAIRARGKAGGMQPWGYSSQWLRDLDGDGRVDILLKDVRVGIGGMMRALVGNTVPIDLDLYRNDDGAFPDQPTIRRRVRRFAPFAGPGKVFFPPVLVGDVNGDGRADLLVGQSPKELHVFLGVPGPDLLARQPREVAVALPYDERKTRLVDLNRDAKQDLLVHRAPSGRTPAEPHRLTLLVAR